MFKYKDWYKKNRDRILKSRADKAKNNPDLHQEVLAKRRELNRKNSVEVLPSGSIGKEAFLLETGLKYEYYLLLVNLGIIDEPGRVGRLIYFRDKHLAQARVVMTYLWPYVKDERLDFKRWGEFVKGPDCLRLKQELKGINEQ